MITFGGRHLLISFFVLAIAVFSPTPITLAQQESGDIEKMMSSDQFKAAGLSKLSPEELQKLNEWLHGYRETTVKTTEVQATKEGRRKFDVVVSRIVGPFYGLTGSNIIRLEDGSAWKQATKADRTRGPGLDHLGVAIFSAGVFGYKMRIQGTPDFYVNQVREH